MNLFHYNNQQAARDAQKADDTKTKAKNAAYDARDLKDQVERLALASQAMWEIIRDKLELQEEDVYEKMEEIDIKDGRRDGKLSGEILTCKQCGRKGNSSRQLCIYCGSPSKKTLLFG
jgi:rubrerythrin